MTDRIAEPWGVRTPYGPIADGDGGVWPVRVDQHLVVDETEVDRWVQSASVLHSNGDALDIAVADARIVGVRGRGVDRVNRGRLDPKDLFGWQANNSPDRLTRPLVRRHGELVEATWDEAMGMIVERSKELLDGPGGWGRFGFYTSGQQLHRRRPLRRHRAVGPQRGRDPDGPVDADARPSSWPEPAAHARRRPAPHRRGS